MWFPSSGLHGFLRPRVFGAAGRKILFPPTLLHSGHDAASSTSSLRDNPESGAI